MIIKCYDCFRDYDDKNGTCPHCGYNIKNDKREANHLPLGTILKDRYIIGRTCGFGGFGVTYKAYDMQLDAIKAIKEYFPNGTVNRVPGTENVVMFTGNRLKEYNYGLTRFLDEARTTAKYVSHKNIVNVFDYFEANKTAYIVMEFLDGITLEKFLETCTSGTEKLDIEQATDITLKICNALKTIHQDGVIHRDVAPDNIYLCVNGTTKLYDFGAARFSLDKDKLLTVILKPGYAPVEQYIEQDEKVNNQGTWTDVYALGATMYKMLTGVKPIESMNRKIKDELQEPNEIDSSIPQYLNDAIMRAMAIERHLRFQTIDEFEAVIKKEKPVKSIKETIKKKKRIRLIGICTAAALVLTGGGIFYSRWDKQKEEETLPPASIEVWYLSDDDAMTNALLDIKEEFCKNYEGVQIELVGIAADEFDSKLSEASELGQLPALFQSDVIDTVNYKVKSLKDVYENLNKGSYYYIEGSKVEILAENKLPLGFNIPIFYMNNTICDYSGNIVSDINDVLGDTGVLTIEPERYEIFKQQYSSEDYNTSMYESFYEGSSELLFSDTSQYFQIRAVLPGQYAMLAIDSDEIQGSFDNCWSLGPRTNEDEEKVAQRFLEYFLSDNAQDYFYIRNTNAGLPLNKNALEVYKEVYSNDVENILINLDAYYFDME